MSPKVIEVATAFMNLSPSEKAELLAFVVPANGPGRRSIGNEDFTKADTINFAPGPKSCRYCGK